MLGPKATLFGGQSPVVPITPQDIRDVQAGRKFLYLWGWARYSDAFPGSAPHVTRFCWQMAAIGDPDKYDPSTAGVGLNALLWFNLHMSEGTCSDDECTAIGLG